jgi:hypothetical protein
MSIYKSPLPRLILWHLRVKDGKFPKGSETLVACLVPGLAAISDKKEKDFRL